ncbi:uncharacterized protein LOC135491664 isoform X2 [Lineus longissimus]|uniref:uncharacterized protein LOC135491664 isoform X2 n=1 Tax=Lineus longissimus TaxID=88925 RepID=UPI002B4E3489
MVARNIFFTTFFLALATYFVIAAEDSAEEVVKEEQWVDKKFDEHGVPVCVKPKPCKGRECKTPCHNGKCHRDGNCVCDDCWEGETCNAYNQSQECTDKLERSVPEEDRQHDEDEHDMGDNPYTENDESRIPKRRRKRSKKRVKRAGGPLTYPTNLKTTFTKTGTSSSLTEGQVGQKMEYKVVLSYPQATAQSTLVEIFTPDNTSLIMQLCNVRITHQGDLITKDDGTKLSDLPIVYDARFGVYPFDRAIINMGNLSCASGAQKGEEQKIEVHIEFDAVMVNCKEQGKTYWVSAGAEYNNENEIWVGQASFKTIGCPATDLIDTTRQPAFTLTNPYSSSGLKVGESGQILLEMQIPHFQVEVAIDAIAPIDKCGVLSICGVLVYSSGTSYQCVPKNVFQFVAFRDKCGKCNGRARLDLGKVTNALKRGAGWLYDKEDTIKIAVYVQFDKAAALNTDFWLGVAVEMGEKTIWTSQTKLQAKAFDKTIAKDSTPKVGFYATSSGSAPVGGAISFILNITTEELKTSDFSIDCLMPFETTARMHICKMEVCANGWNVPCVVPEDPVYSSRATPKDSNMDRVLLKLGHVTNHAVLSKNESASTISVCLYASVLKHAKNTANAKMWVTCGLNVGDTKLWVGSKEITVTADAPSATPFDATKAPKMELKYGYESTGTGLVVGDYYTNSLADVRFDVTLKPQYKYDPMDIEVILPYEANAPVFSICHVEILYAGKNLPCFQRAAKNETFKLLSKSGNNLTAPDRATNTLGSMYCVNNGNDKNETHDMFVIRTVVKIEDHPTTKATPKAFLSFGIQYHTTAIYVAQLALQVKTITNAPLNAAQSALLVVHLKTADGTITINQGESKSLLLVVKFPPQSTSDYEVIVEVDNNQAAICQVGVKSLGHNMKCTKVVGDPTYEKWTDGDKGNKKATFKLGRITNPGGEKLNGTEPEKAAIVFDVPVKVSATVTPGTVISVTAKVTYFEDTTPKAKAATPVGLKVGAAGAMKTKNGTRPDFNFARAPMLDGNDTTPPPSTVVPGQHFRCFMDITLQPGSCVGLTSKFMGPLGKDGVMDITDIRVWGIGKSMPCTSLNSGPPEVITKRSGQKCKDVGSLNMGQICSFAKDGTPAKYRKIRVEVIGRIRIANTLKSGESFWFSSIMTVNDDQLYVSQIKMQLAPIASFVDVENPDLSTNASMYFDTGVTLLTKKIHETFTLPVVVMVPVNSTCKANMDFTLQMNDTATMTLKEVKIVSSGANLKGMVEAGNPDKYNITYSSTQKTSQNDKAIIGPFIVTNSGITDREGITDKADPAKDNAFTVELTIQMADALKNANNAFVWASVGAKICKFIIIADKKIQVIQETTNVPILDATATLDKTTMKKGETVTVSGTMKHDDKSKAECLTTHLKFFIPGFMYYSGGFVSKLATDQVNFTENYFTVKWTRFLFTDNTTFSFQLEIKTDGTLPTDADSGKVTIPYEPGCNMHHRNNNPASLEFIPSEMKSVSLTLTGMKGPPKTCTPKDLTLNDKNAIKDCQLSCSAEVDKNFPDCIRKSSTTGCKFPMRKGAEKERYVQFFFWEKTVISGLIFYKPSSATCEVTKFVVKYSNDLMGWVEGTENTVVAYGAGGAETPVSDGESGVAKAVRVYLIADNCDTAAKVLTIKMDLKGCEDSANKPADRSDPCTYKPLSWQTKDSAADTTYGHRSFVIGGTGTPSIYYCDANPTNKLQMNCFSSSEAGGTSATKRMSNMVAHITGYYSKYGELYAIAQNGKAYLMSEDAGLSWVTITKDRWGKCASDPTCAKAQSVPWDATSTSSAPSYKQSIWGGSASGLWVQKGSKWEQVTDWTTCCT